MLYKSRITCARHSGNKITEAMASEKSAINRETEREKEREREKGTRRVEFVSRSLVIGIQWIPGIPLSRAFSITRFLQAPTIARK